MPTDQDEWLERVTRPAKFPKLPTQKVVFTAADLEAAKKIMDQAVAKQPEIMVFADPVVPNVVFVVQKPFKK